MTTPVKLPTSSGQEKTSTSNPYVSRLTLIGKTHYFCNFCKINFLNITCCIRHIRTHTGEKPFSCSYCKQSFARKYTAQVHEKIHTGEKPYYCEACGLSFPSSSHLNYHRKQKKNIACSASGSKGTRSNLSPSTTSKLIVAVGPDQRRRRQIATKTNNSSVEIATVKHVKVQTGDRPYMCKYSYCSKAFALKCNAKAHERTHLGVNSYHCSVCNKGFRSNSGLKYHLTKSKKSKCSTDAIRVRADSAALQITKPVLPIMLTMPEIKQKSQEGQDQIVVPGRNTSTDPNLIRQKMDGKVFHFCIYCQKKFKKRYVALDHVKAHTAGKHFTCTHPNCSKSYPREKALSRHQKTHSEQRH